MVDASLRIARAYYVGFMAQEAILTTNFYRMYPKGEPFIEAEIKSITKTQLISLRWGNDMLYRLERIILLKHIAAATGSACIVSALVLWIYHLFDIGVISSVSIKTKVIFFVALIIYVAVARHANLRQVEVQARLIDELHDKSPIADSTPRT
jgi:hypothetical protein